MGYRVSEVELAGTFIVTWIAYAPVFNDHFEAILFAQRAARDYDKAGLDEQDGNWWGRTKAGTIIKFVVTSDTDPAIPLKVKVTIPASSGNAPCVVAEYI